MLLSYLLHRLWLLDGKLCHQCNRVEILAEISAGMSGENKFRTSQDYNGKGNRRVERLAYLRVKHEQYVLVAFQCHLRKGFPSHLTIYNRNTTIVIERSIVAL